MSIKLITPVFRVSYAKIWEPTIDDKGNPYYGMSMIFSKDANQPNGLKDGELDKLRNAIKAAIAEKWGKDESKWPRTLKNCMRDADKEDRTNPSFDKFDATYVNSWFINTKSKNQPGVVDENVQPILDQNDFYSGCYARASIVFSAYDNVAKGVGCYLNNIMKVADGERLGGAPPAQEDFAAFATNTTAEAF